MSVDKPFLLIHLLHQYTLAVNMPFPSIALSIDTPFPLIYLSLRRKKTATNISSFCLAGLSFKSLRSVWYNKQAKNPLSLRCTTWKGQSQFLSQNSIRSVWYYNQKKNVLSLWCTTATNSLEKIILFFFLEISQVCVVKQTSKESAVTLMLIMFKLSQVCVVQQRSKESAVTLVHYCPQQLGKENHVFVSFKSFRSVGYNKQTKKLL